MKNVKNILHDSSTFVVPISSMGDDVTEFGIALLDDFGIQQSILIVKSCVEVDFAIGQNERLGELFR